MPIILNKNHIFDSLYKYLRDYKGDFAPGSRQLASLFKISPESIRAQLKLMQLKGLLEIKPRSRARILREAFELQPSSIGGAAVRVRNQILQKIREGDYSEGMELPKVNTLCKELQASDHTIRKALSYLSAENYISRAGKQFIVSQIYNHKKQNSEKLSAICVIQPFDYSWESFQTNLRTSKFVQQFIELVENKSIILKFVACEDLSRKDVVIAEFINKALSDSSLDFIGILAIGNKSPRYNITNIMAELVKHNIPTVWFDPNDQDQNVKMHHNLTRCYFNERNAIYTALRYLSDHGHQKIAYLQTERHDWQSARGDLIKEIANKNFPKLSIQIEKFFQAEYTTIGDSRLLNQRLDLLNERPDSEFKKAMDYLVEHAKDLLSNYKIDVQVQKSDIRQILLTTLYHWGMNNKAPNNTVEGQLVKQVMSWLPLQAILDSNVTAILCPNDAMAKNFIIPWLLNCNIPIPEQISLISFDSRYLPMLVQVNSVDMGFGYLGEMAFKTFFKKHSLQRIRNRNIGSHAHVVDRGSVRWI